MTSALNNCPYDPEGGSLCAPCLTSDYEDLALSVLSGIILLVWSMFGFTLHFIRTAHIDRSKIRASVTPVEKLLFFILVILLWMNEFSLLHLWRLSPITVGCPPSGIYIGVKIINGLLGCLLFTISFMSRSLYIYRFYSWLPQILQFTTILVYYMDAFAREDICWGSFVVIPSVLISLMILVNIPYVLSGAKLVFPMHSNKDFKELSSMTSDTQSSDIIADDEKSVRLRSVNGNFYDADDESTITMTVDTTIHMDE